jgi:hypothetical protein
MRSRVHSNDLSDRPKLRQDDSRNHYYGNHNDQTNYDETTTFFLLRHFFAAFLTFTLPLSTHENSFILMISRWL